MFSIFKKKKELKNPWEDRRWFINDVIDAIREIKDPNAQLGAYIALHKMTHFWETKFDLECIEMSLAFDEISDAFLAADNVDLIYESALSYALLPPEAKRRLRKFYKCDLAQHLKLRLFRCYIDVSLNEEWIDPREIDPRYQHAFYEIEKLDLCEMNKRILLEEEFGVSDWKSRRELNRTTGIYF